MSKLINRIACFFLSHDWTCKAEKGIKPQEGETFGQYGLMYCDRCGHVSQYSKDFYDRVPTLRDFPYSSPDKSGSQK